MKRTIVALLLLHAASTAGAAPALDGEYLCDACHGYLTVKSTKDHAYQVWLGMGGGSCGGYVFAEAKAVRAVGNAIRLPWRTKKKTCTTTIAFEDGQATVSDTCTQPKDEDSSTCAVLGSYTKRDPS